MFIQALRRELSHPRTSIQLCLVAIVGGVSAAALIILFRLSFEGLQGVYLEQVGDFSTLSRQSRFFLPLLGVVGILLFAAFIRFKHYRMGIPYVIHRIRFHHGLIPFRSTIHQFFGGMWSLASGMVVGREGPSVHLGAAGSSYLGRWLKLPHNSIRILAGCGIAAGISASFNTPFAAMIFVMEVVLREYRIHIFIPIMLASACGSVLTRMVFGRGHELAPFHYVNLEPGMYLYLILFGVFLGLLATLFNRNLMLIMHLFKRVPMWQRFLLAGLITGAIGALQPHALAASFVGVSNLIEQQSGFALLLTVLVCKFLLATFALGLGIPGGIIGPLMVIGMLAGVAFMLPLGIVAQVDGLTHSFALLGLAGMLCASLQAPMAALSAVMELAFAPEVILPAMLVIVPAYLTSTQLLKNKSIFIMQLDYQQLPYSTSSVSEHLHKTGVMAVMDHQFKTFNQGQHGDILAYLDSTPTAKVIECRQHNATTDYALVQYDVSLDHYASSPLTFFTMQGVHCSATLDEVYQILNVCREGGVYIYADGPDDIIGIISWNMLNGKLLQEQF